MKIARILLILIAVVCIGVAVSYPIRYKMELDSATEEIESLSDMRRRVLVEEHIETPIAPNLTDTPEPTDPPTEPPVTAPPESEAPAPTVEATAEATAEATEPPGRAQPTDIPPAETSTGEVTMEIDVSAPPEETAPEAEKTFTPGPSRAATPTPTPRPTPTPGFRELLLEGPEIQLHTPTPTPTPSPTPSPTPDRRLRNDADPYENKKKKTLVLAEMLPELRDIWDLNHDLVGWIYIAGTNIDYPVVQTADREYYLRRDFYGNDNANGQIILDAGCDPYTPSYNLVISGHHMNSGAMFGRLQVYKDYDFWRTHKVVEFDSLMERKQYVVFAAFYSADYDENEEGFRYSVNIQYKIDADNWLKDINAYKIYETGIDVKFGDEFITLTTCDHSRRDDGRFVVVARRIREGETII